MGEDKDGIGNIEYIVGSEKTLKEIISEAEVMPLLKSAVRTGASKAGVISSDGKTLWIYSSCSSEVRSPRRVVECDCVEKDRIITETEPLYLEGEVIGHVEIEGDNKGKAYLKGLSGLLHDALNIILNNNLKRMLTTEIHTTVVNQSYEELLETNSRLRISEGKSRELAESLDKKVRERTRELKHAYAKLLQQEKMASIGQLAAGVAHEINNPLGFISSNLNTLKKYIKKLKEMIEFYRTGGDLSKESEELYERLKIDFIMNDIPDLIRQSMEGAERVKKIVSDLKGFSHIDDSYKTIIDINTEIDRTISVLAHEIPKDAEIIRDYHKLPEFICTPALICQVFLNIILNAIQAKSVGDPEREGLKLRISTTVEDGNIRISFSDNGPGIAEDLKNRIFEPFFTTKDIGKGTGMGLTVVYEIVTAYGGSIDVESLTGKGTAFIIRLPLKGLQ